MRKGSVEQDRDILVARKQRTEASAFRAFSVSILSHVGPSLWGGAAFVHVQVFLRG